jgi:hypothetical protein
MNCRNENYNTFITRKMLGWRELAVYGVDRYERARGRRNLRSLLDAHPDVAVDCGLGLLADLLSGHTESQVPGLDG